MTDALLDVSAVRYGYGDLIAVWDVSFTAKAGRICAVVGRNGAGKTTMCSGIGGLLPLRAGSVHLDGRDISRLQPWARASAGLALVPDGKRIFRDLTVHENLTAGLSRRKGSGQGASGADIAYDLFPVLRARQRSVAGELSGGQQQMLSIGQALVRQPRVLLIDEPSSGLAPVIVAEIFETLRELRVSGMAVVIVEQIEQIKDLADDLVAIAQGRVVASGALTDFDLAELGMSVYL